MDFVHKGHVSFDQKNGGRRIYFDHLHRVTLITLGHWLKIKRLPLRLQLPETYETHSKGLQPYNFSWRHCNNARKAGEQVSCFVIILPLFWHRNNQAYFYSDFCDCWGPLIGYCLDTGNLATENHGRLMVSTDTFFPHLWKIKASWIFSLLQLKVWGGPDHWTLTLILPQTLSPSTCSVYTILLHSWQTNYAAYYFLIILLMRAFTIQWTYL